MLTYWTADSSILKRFNWMNCDDWVLETDKALRAWDIVEEFAEQERHAVDGSRLNLELWESLEFHEVSLVSLGWQAEDVAEKLAVVL